MSATWLPSSQKLENMLADCHKKTAPRNGDDNNAGNPGRSWLPIYCERISIIASKSSPCPIKDGEEKDRNPPLNLLLFFSDSSIRLCCLLYCISLINKKFEGWYKELYWERERETEKRKQLGKENINIERSTLEMCKYCIDVFLFESRLHCLQFYFLLSLFYLFIFHIKACKIKKLLCRQKRMNNKCNVGASKTVTPPRHEPVCSCVS